MTAGNDSVFPILADGSHFRIHGMTMRELIAMQLYAGLLAADGPTRSGTEAAKMAVRAADSLIAALNSTSPKSEEVGN